MYTIGIVTYHARFEEYFKPLIKRLGKVFPDIEIVCILNGYPDQSLQLNYLDKATRFLSTRNNVRYLTHTDHQSLSRCWNQLILLSETKHVLIINDDTEVSELFRSELEPTVGTAPLITYNKSWSHFLISKALIQKIGWFDERFLGVGYEDGDYAYRMTMASIPIKNVNCHGLRNFVADNKDPGFKAISKSTGKYASINKDFFDSKWLTPDNRPDIDAFEYVSDFNDGQYKFTPVIGMETPDFYDATNLLWEEESNIKKKAYTGDRIRLSIQKVYFVLGRKVARLLRALRRLT